MSPSCIIMRRRSCMSAHRTSPRCTFSAAPLTPAKSRTSAGSTPWTSRSAAVREPCCAAAAAQRSRGRRPMSTAFPAATQRSAPCSSASARQACSPPSYWRRRDCSPLCSSAAIPRRCAGKRLSASGAAARWTPRATSSSARAAQVRFPTASSTPARRTSAAAGCFSSLYASVRRRKSSTTPNRTSGQMCCSTSFRTCGKRCCVSAAKSASARA